MRENRKRRTVGLALEFPSTDTLECAVLGCIVLDDSLWPQAAVLAPEDFGSDSHRRIVRRMRDLAAAGRPIDSITLTAELAKRSELEAVGGAAYLSFLTNGHPRRTSVVDYVIGARGGREALRRERSRGTHLTRAGGCNYFRN